MKTALIIGGSRFLGPAVIDMLLEEGYKVTTFNRGSDYGVNLPKEVEQLHGDRREGVNMDSIADSQYDIVYDMCCYNQIDATNLLRVMRPCANLVLLSTAAVYKKPTTYPLSESDALGEWDSFGDYGSNKALVEEAFRSFAKLHKIRLTIFRPTYLLGPYDYFDRENYYFSRIKKSLPILMPGNGAALMQFAFLDETAKAFVSVPKSQQIPIEVLNIGGDDLISNRSFIEICGRIVGKKPQIVALNCAEHGLVETHFYDDLYPFPNLNFITDNTRSKSLYGVRYVSLSDGLKQLYPTWVKDWRNEVKLYPQEKKILRDLGHHE